MDGRTGLPDRRLRNGSAASTRAQTRPQVVFKDDRVCHYLNRKLDEDAICDLVTAVGAVCLGTP